MSAALAAVLLATGGAPLSPPPPPPPPAGIFFSQGFGDRMVLAAAGPALFGGGAAGCHRGVTVVVAAGARSGAVEAEMDPTAGTWRAVLPAQKPGSGFNITASCTPSAGRRIGGADGPSDGAITTATLNDVAFGDVLVCAGECKAPS